MSRVKLSACLLLVVGLGALPASAPASSLTGRLLVMVDRAPGQQAQVSAARAVTARAGVRPAAQIPQIGLVTVAIPAGSTAAEVAARLRADPRVRSVVPEGRMKLRLTPNDPALTAPETSPGTPAGTPIQWTAARDGLFGAWDFARGAGALVGVIDTGIDASHPEFAGKLAATVDQELLEDTGPATTDATGHGTHVSSLACAASNNGIGIAGAGYDCRLIFEKTDLSDTSIAQSIVDATDRRALSINMSFGDDGSRPTVPAIADAIDYAFQRNVVLVAAAADEDVSEQGQPPNLLQPTGTGPDITAGKGLSVTSATFFGNPSGGGQGSQISLAAYGSFNTFSDPNGPGGLLGAFPSNVTSLDTGTLVPPSPPCLCRATFNGDNRYAYLQGTSMAAPQVAAVAALVRKLNPDLRAKDVLQLLKRTARRPAGSGWTPGLGWGILDAGAAVRGARTLDRRAPTSRLRAPRLTSHRSFTLRWSGSDRAPAGVIASGLRRFEVYRSIGTGGPRRIASTLRHSLRVRGVPGKRYSFFTLAVDRAGNREPRPARPDAVTRVRR